ENAINKAKYLSHNGGNKFTKILHSGSTATKPNHHKISYITKTYFTPKVTIS
ncbi:7847_t:CDS:1, partial [Entrophospora sp. SA101]